MWKDIEHSENKMVRQSGPFENEIGPGVLQSGIQQPEGCKNTKGTNHVQLIMCRSCPCRVKFCRFYVCVC